MQNLCLNVRSGFVDYLPFYNGDKMFTLYYELYSTQHGVRAFFCPVFYPLMARLIH